MNSQQSRNPSVRWCKLHGFILNSQWIKQITYTYMCMFIYHPEKLSAEIFFLCHQTVGNGNENRKKLIWLYYSDRDEEKIRQYLALIFFFSYCDYSFRIKYIFKRDYWRKEKKLNMNIIIQDGWMTERFSAYRFRICDQGISYALYWSIFPHFVFFSFFLPCDAHTVLKQMLSFLTSFSIAVELFLSSFLFHIIFDFKWVLMRSVSNLNFRCIKGKGKKINVKVSHKRYCSITTTTYKLISVNCFFFWMLWIFTWICINQLYSRYCWPFRCKIWLSP